MTKKNNQTSLNDALKITDDTRDPLAEVTPLFPVEVFPPKFVEMLTVFTNKGESLSSFLVYYLSVLSVAIGNSTEIRSWCGRWSTRANIYILLASLSGTNKSGKKKAAEAPLKLIDAIYTEENVEANRKYNSNRFKWLREKLKDPDYAILGKTELKRFFIEANGGPPSASVIAVNQVTIEALVKKLESSPRGILFSRDEFSALMNELDAYRGGKGADLDMLLELHSNGDLYKIRATQADLRLQSPFMSLMGGIQPGLLSSLFSDEMCVKGFPQRFMFVFPETHEVKAPSLEDLQDPTMYSKYTDEWTNFIVGIHKANDYDQEEGPMELKYNLAGRKAIVDWLGSTATPLINNAPNDTIRSLSSKLDYWIYKSIILLHVLDTCYGNGQSKVIEPMVSTETIHKALELCDYWFAMWIKAYRVSLAQDNKGIKLAAKRKMLYDLLPNSFTKGDATTIGSDHGILKPTAVHNFLSDKSKVVFDYDVETLIYSKLPNLDIE